MDGQGTGTALTLQRHSQTGLTVYDRVDPMDFIDKMGIVFARTGAGGAQTEQDGKLLALACVSRRMDVFELNQTYHLISGKLVKKADVMLGDFRRAGGKHRWIADGTDGKTATLELTPKGEQPSTYTFTIEMAKAAGYVKSGSQWTKRPDQMLRARCITDLIGMVAPELKCGDYSEEEIDDISSATPSVGSMSQATTASVTRSPDLVKARQAELAAMNGAGASQQVTTQSSTPTTKKDEAIIEAEFTTAPAATPSSKVESSQAPLGDAADLPEHTQQASVMEVELMVGQLGWTVEQVMVQINAGRAKKGDGPISELGQLDPANMQALMGNMRKLIEKKLAAEGVPFATN